MRRLRDCLFLGFVLAVGGCAGSGTGVPKLASVDALPAPALPAWIASISPTGGATPTLAQIRVIFAKPVATLAALSGDGPRSVLEHVEIAPALAGHFVVFTPRMIGFVPDRALPIATRVRVTLTAGLRDLDGDVLGRDLAWTFASAPLTFSGLPSLKSSDDEPSPAPVGLEPTLTFVANARLDTGTLDARVRLHGGGDDVATHVSLEAQPTPMPGSGASALFDPSLNDWVYDVKPTRPLRKGTTYALQLEPGIAPAYGNLPSIRAASGRVRTYGAFALVAPQPTSAPGYGSRFANGDPYVTFTNPLDPKSIAGAVTVSPAPTAVKSIAYVPDGTNTLALDPYALDPDATYRVTIAAGVKDIFGQSLGTPQTVTIRTSDFAAGAWAPSGINTIAATAGVALNFYATNLPGNAYQSAFASLAPQSLLTAPNPNDMLPVGADWPKHTIAGARRNVQSVVTTGLARELGAPYGTLAYGYETALDGNNAPSLTGIVQLTNLGVFAQYFPSSGHVMVQHLDDGSPAAGIALTFYRIDPSSASPVPQRCASGITDANGTYALQGPALQACYAFASFYNAPTLGVVASAGSDVASLATQGWSGIANFNVMGGWTGGGPLSRGTIFSDRQMYQPGESGDLTGVAYYVAGSGIVADKNAAYKVTLSDPNNATTSLGTVRTDAYGIFTLPLKLGPRQPLGYYSVSATGPSGNAISGSFRVAEFKPPNFKLALTLAAPSALAGSAAHASVAAAYLFGAPLQGGVAHATVTRDVAALAPAGWDDFSFGPQWFYPEQQPSFDTDVMQRDYTLDAQGNVAFDVAVPATLPFPMTYTVDVATTDVSNLSVADNKTFLALPSDAIIGLDSDVVGAAGSPMAIRAIVTDANGKAIAGRTVHLDLQKMTYTSATQAVAGGENAQQAIQYQTVASADLTSAAQPVGANLTPPDPGPYRVVANFGGAKSAATATDIQVFAFGGSAADWGSSNAGTTPVQLDAKSYKVGDVATALIASPYAHADVYVSVVRNDVLYQTVLRNVSGSPRVKFAVTRAMVPNAAIQAVVVRRGAPLARLKPGSIDALAVVGMTGFNVDVKDRYLKLTIAPAHAKVEPGAAQSVAFTLKDSAGKPARGEVVAMVVNDAILQLSGYREPDLVQTVFAAQPISTIFSDNRQGMLLTTQTPPTEKGFGYGGGYLAGAASTRVRENFLPLAYFGRAIADASGRATIHFNLPDNLTTWRVLAIAVGSDDAHFGNADATFVASLPLSTNPLLPQFARPGDRFDLGVSVFDQTDAGGALALGLDLRGALRFSTGSPTTRTVRETVASGMQAFRFPVDVGTPAPSGFKASSTLGAARDAFSVPFTVLDGATTASRFEAGATAGSARVPLGNVAHGGTVRITLANSIVPQFAVPADTSLTDDWLALADIAASRLIVASALAQLQVPYHLTLAADPRPKRAEALGKLLALQRDDGGFGVFAGASASDPFASAYALDALLFARARGVAVDSGALARVRTFLAQSLANPGRFAWCTTAAYKARVRFAMLEALAADGDRRTTFLGQIYAQRETFDSAGQIRLARYLLATPGWQAQGARLADRLQTTLYVTGRYAVANTNAPWAWLGSQVDAQAQMLQLLLQRHAPVEQTDGAVRALVAQSCNCGWATLDDTATALSALSAYAATEHLRPSTASVTVGDRTVASAHFGATASSQAVTVAADSLRGATLDVRASGGTVHYSVLYTYPVPANAPGVLTAFRVIRSVAAAGASTPLATMDLAAVAPVSLGPSRVFDVRVRVIVDHPVDRLTIVDPLPAGLEAVDASLNTTSTAVVAASDSWQIDTQQIYRDRVVAYAQHLGPGIYDIHYLVRSVTPGVYAWPGARAYLVDAPEQAGRSAATTLTVGGS